MLKGTLSHVAIQIKKKQANTQHGYNVVIATLIVFWEAFLLPYQLFDYVGNGHSAFLHFLG